MLAIILLFPHHPKHSSVCRGLGKAVTLNQLNLSLPLANFFLVLKKILIILSKTFFINREFIAY